MNVNKCLWVVSFLSLSACVSHQAALDTQQPYQTPAPTITPEQKESSTTTATEKTTATKKTADNETDSDIQPTDTSNSDASQSKKHSSRTTAASSKITSWEISGAIAARNKNKGWNASLNWLQRGSNQYQIRLSGPLGGGTMIISKQGGKITLRDGAKTVSSSNASALLKQQTGVSLPVGNLYYWVRGVPAPGSVQGEKREQNGRISVLKQDGYTIQYLQYSMAGQTLLPSIIKLQGNGVFIKLVIKNWKL